MSNHRSSLPLVCALALAAFQTLTGQIQPRLTATRSLIGPDTTIRVHFPTDMVSTEQVGKLVDNTILTISPTWRGRLRWDTKRVARFRPQEQPALGTGYTFTSELTQDVAGKPVTKSKPSAWRTPGFEIYRGWPPSHRTTGPEAREPKVILQFTAPIDENSLRKSASFRSGDRIVPVRVASVKKDSLFENQAYSASWHRLLSAGKESGPVTTYEIQPLVKLPVGDAWRLHVNTGVESGDGSLITTKSELYRLPNVVPMRIERIEASRSYQSPHEIVIRFNKALHSGMNAETLLASWLDIEPKRGGMKASLTHDRRSLVIHAEHREYNEVTINVQPWILADDGLALARDHSQKVRFEPLKPLLALPSTDEAQMRFGKRQYPILTGNVKETRVRVKKLSPWEALFARNGYDTYETGTAIPFEAIAGKTILDRVYLSQVGLDRQENVFLNWEEILPGKAGGMLMVQAEGSPKHDSGKKEARLTAQALVQVTDLGLAWKFGRDQLVIYAYSHDTGSPIADAKVIGYSAEGESLMQALTDTHGVVMLPVKKDARRFMISKDGDHHLVTRAEMETYAPWQFGIEWSDETPERERRCLLFTDRNLYRPSDTVYLKGITRLCDGITLEPEISQATLEVRDSRRRVIVSRECTLSPQGSFSEQMILPEKTVGTFTASVSFEPNNDGYPNQTFQHSWEVQEFRRNQFEIHLEKPGTLTLGDDLKMRVRANYFMGKPLSESKGNWFTTFQAAGFYPDDYRDYLFGDHRSFDRGYWRHYYGDQSASHHNEKPLQTLHGEFRLDSDGKALLDFGAPVTGDLPTPIRYRASAEITDLNQQTLTQSSSDIIHSSAFYLGLGRQSRTIPVGKTISLPVVAVNTQGELVPLNHPVTLTLTKQEWRTVKVQSAGGQLRNRNEMQMEPVEQREVTLQGSESTVDVVLPETGTYHLTASTKDAEGRPVVTAIAITGYGEDRHWWRGVDGVAMELLPEKQRYVAGENARLLVKTPVEGTALVTVERDRVLRSFTTTLSGDAPVIEVPLEASDGPNIFVSVMVVQGAAQSRYLEHRQPLVKLGYANIEVAMDAERLVVTTAADQETYRPGETVQVITDVRDVSGNPVANTEVTLFAVDEGVLSVMDTPTPQPLKVFFPPQRLSVCTGTSLENLLPDRDLLGHYGNKGVIIGDGGGSFFDQYRKDFRACAFWQADLVTDAQGMVSARFQAPDSLTRYRITAVAAAGATQFGSNTSSFEVNKPVMLQPIVPRYANVSDKLVVRALLHNQTPDDHRFTVTLQLGETAHHEGSLEVSSAREIAVGAGKSTTLAFPVTFTSPGEAQWRWSVTPLMGSDARLLDAVESVFPVAQPIPLRKDRLFTRVQGEAVSRDLLKELNSDIVHGEGSLTVTLSNTRLVEAASAIEQMLTYPYG